MFVSLVEILMKVNERKLMRVNERKFLSLMRVNERKLMKVNYGRRKLTPIKLLHNMLMNNYYSPRMFTADGVNLYE